MQSYMSWRKGRPVTLPAAGSAVAGAIVGLRISDADIISTLNEQGEGKSLAFTLDDGLTGVPHHIMRTDWPATKDGAYSWFSRPEAARIGGLNWHGMINQFGQVCACCLTDAGVYTETVLETLSGGTGAGINDHNNPAVIEVAPGIAGFFYSDHNGTILKFRKQTTAGNPTAFNAAVSISVTNTAYAVPVMIGANIYVFTRAENGVERPRSYSVSTDGGATWSALVHLFYSPDNTDRESILNRPYLHAVGDATKIHFFLSDGQPNEVTDPVTAKYVNSLWHCYYDSATGNMHKSDGTVMAGGTFAVPPAGGFDTALATKVCDGYAAQHPFWNWDIQLDADGNPCFVALEFVGNPDNYTDALVVFGRWTGSAWVVNQLTGIDGISGYSTPVGPGGPESWYHGGAVLDPANPSGRMLVSWPNPTNAAAWDILVLTSADEGTTWTYSSKLNTTRGNERKCIRPLFPRGYDESVLLALWMEGHYRSFQGTWTGSGSSWETDRFATGIQTYPRFTDGYVAFVKVDLATSAKTINMYWDNADAAEQANPDAVFDGWLMYQKDIHLNVWNTGVVVNLTGITEFTVVAINYWDRATYSAAQHVDLSNWSGTTAGIFLREQAAAGNNQALIFNSTTATPAGNTAWSVSPAVQVWNVKAAMWKASVSGGVIRPVLNGTALTNVTGTGSPFHATPSTNPIWLGWSPHTNGDLNFHGMLGFAGFIDTDMGSAWVVEFSESNPFDPTWSYAAFGTIESFTEVIAPRVSPRSSSLPYPASLSSGHHAGGLRVRRFGKDQS